MYTIYVHTVHTYSTYIHSCIHTPNLYAIVDFGQVVSSYEGFQLEQYFIARFDKIRQFGQRLLQRCCCMYVCMYVNMYVCKYDGKLALVCCSACLLRYSHCFKNPYIHTYIYTRYIHTYIHTYIHILNIHTVHTYILFLHTHTNKDLLGNASLGLTGSAIRKAAGRGALVEVQQVHGLSREHAAHIWSGTRKHARR